MKALFRSIFLYFFAIVATSFCAFPVHADEVRVGIGFALAPYVIHKKDRGLEVDIIREALALSGHEATFVYLPNLRLPMAYDLDEVDCVAANVAYDLEGDSGRKGFPSASTVAYRNYAMTLAESELVIDSLDDLADKRVLGFNNAKKYLGPDFVEAVKDNHEYSELADQSLQVRMLYSKRVEVVISDKRIFLWWRGKLEQSPMTDMLNFALPVVYHPIFPASPRHVTFAQARLRDDFNAGLERLRASGRYDAIIRWYLADDTSH